MITCSRINNTHVVSYYKTTDSDTGFRTDHIPVSNLGRGRRADVHKIAKIIQIVYFRIRRRECFEFKGEEGGHREYQLNRSFNSTKPK
jgi:hypothetical protein